MKDIQKIRETAQAYYGEGGLLCAEAVAKAICEQDEAVDTDMVVAMTSGFPGGMGSGCTCGALAGGVVVLGLYYGRKEGFADNTPIMKRSSSLHNQFKKTYGSTCCRALTHKFDKAKGEHKEQCLKITGDVAEWVAQSLWTDAK